MTPYKGCSALTGLVWPADIGVLKKLLVRSIVIFEALVGYGCDVPPSVVIEGRSIPTDDIHLLRQSRILRDREQIEYAYFAGLKLLDDGNLLTDSRLISYYQDQDQEIIVNALALSDIYSVELDSMPGFLEDSVFDVYASDLNYAFSIFLPNNHQADGPFLSALERSGILVFASDSLEQDEQYSVESSVSSGIASIKGVNWEMSLSAMTASLEARGFNCDSESKEILSCFDGEAEVKSHTGNLLFPIYGPYINFNCSAVNICGLSLDESAEVTATALNLNLSLKHIPSLGSGTGWLSYQGTDRSGQRVVIYEFVSGLGSPEVLLFKHRLENPQPDFD